MTQMYRSLGGDFRDKAAHWRHLQQESELGQAVHKYEQYLKYIACAL